jgi:nucleoside phosphorylase
MAIEKIDWLVCFAVPEEARFFKALHGQRALVTGMGKKNTVRALDQALKKIEPCAVLTCGFAGGLEPGLECGTVLFDAQGGTERLREKALKAGAAPGKFLEAEKVAVTANQKKQLHARSGASAVEMESEAAIDLARRKGIPALTVRVILDPADQDLPLDFNKLMTADMKMNYLALGWAILRQPAKISAVQSFQQQVMVAARALGAVLTRITEAVPRD